MTILAWQKEQKNKDEVIEIILAPTNTVGDDGTECLFFSSNQTVFCQYFHGFL